MAVRATVSARTTKIAPARAENGITNRLSLPTASRTEEIQMARVRYVAPEELSPENKDVIWRDAAVLYLSPGR